MVIRKLLSLWKWNRIQDIEQAENTEKTERPKTSFQKIGTQFRLV